MEVFNFPRSQQVLGTDSVETINARDLHKALKVGRDFSNWIKDRLNRGKFVENKHYVVFANSGENPQGGRPSIEYYITIDVAKHISMLENNEVGFMVRDYFIDCERQLLRDRAEYAERQAWGEMREIGIVKRKEWTDAIQHSGHFSPMMVAKATNKVYVEVAGHVAADLKEILETEHVRDKLNKNTLHAICLSEDMAKGLMAIKGVASAKDYVDYSQLAAISVMNTYELVEPNARKIMHVADTRKKLPAPTRMVYTPTELLKSYKMSTVAFNKLMKSKGLLEIRQRPSTSKPGEYKDYYALSEEKYGVNEPKLRNGQVVDYQVKYYADTFGELVELLGT